MKSIISTMGPFTPKGLIHETEGTYYTGPYEFHEGQTAMEIIDDIYGGAYMGFRADFPGLGRSAFDPENRNEVPMPKFRSTDYYSTAANPDETLTLIKDEIDQVREIMTAKGWQFDENKKISSSPLPSDNMEYMMNAQWLAYYENLSSFTFQRFRPHLWYIQDMKGKHVKVSPELQEAISIFDAIARRFFTSVHGRKEVRAVFMALTDPRFTNVGWPFFVGSSSPDFMGFDEKKREVIKLFAGTFDGYGKGLSYQELKQRLSDAAGSIPFGIPPLSYLVNVRARLATKPGPWYEYVNGRATFRGYLDGIPLARIAQNASYIGNQVLAGPFAMMKALRKNLTGCWHDATERAKYMTYIAEYKLISMESDISGYDLNFAVEPTDMLSEVFAKYSCDPEFFRDILLDLRRLPIVIPHPDNLSYGPRKRDGLLLTPVDIMLPSGIKPTAEFGTFGNVLVSIMHQRGRGMRRADIINYWLPESNVRSQYKIEQVLQGDDKAFFGKDTKSLSHLVNSEIPFYGHIGVKSKPAYSDRFLQRHMSFGIDKPVMGRMVQQRLSNEDAPIGYAHMVMGYVSSLNNVNQHRGPWLSKQFLSQTALSNRDAALRFCSDRFSSSPEGRGLSLMKDCLLIAAEKAPDVLEVIKIIQNQGTWEDTEQIRKVAQEAITANFTLSDDGGAVPQNLQDWLLYLQNNQYSYQYSTLISQIEDGDLGPELQALWKHGLALENKFTHEAFATLGIDLNLKIVKGTT